VLWDETRAGIHRRFTQDEKTKVKTAIIDHFVSNLFIINKDMPYISWLIKYSIHDYGISANAHFYISIFC